MADIPLLHDDEAEALWRESSTLFVDVRSPADYEVGHIAGAVNLPEEDYEARLPSLLPQAGAGRGGRGLLQVGRLRQEPLGGRCDCGSTALTVTKIYPGGWNEKWSNRGLPAVRSSI